MEEGGQLQLDEHRRNRGMFNNIICSVLFYLFAIYYFFETFVNWDDLTTCFKRETVVNCLYLIYLHFANSKRPTATVDIFQILLVLWIIEGYNKADEDVDALCLNTGDTVFLQVTNWVFEFLLWFYTAMTFCMIVLIVFIIIYSIVELFYLQPRRRARQGLTPAELSKLEKVEFKKGELDAESNLDTCSICLEEFVENQVLLQLPVCRHNFHENCVQEWLNLNSVCPYCRSDIRQNLREVSDNSNVQQA